MPKKSVSVTLDETNLLWLRGRGYGRGNLSAALDGLIAAARASGVGAPAQVRTVVGTIDIAADDVNLERADATVRDLFAQSLSRPLMVREPPPGTRPAPRGKRTKRRG